jgi:hypothetical protein
VAASAQEHQRTQIQLKNLEKQQKEQRKECDTSTKLSYKAFGNCFLFMFFWGVGGQKMIF